MPLTERQQMALLLEMSAKEFQEQKRDKTKKSGEASGSKRVGSSKGEFQKVNKRNKRGETQLHLASIKGDIDGVRSLIKRGADVNITDHAGWTSLHEACSRGHYKIVKVLLKAGADVDAKGLEDDTPLHDASSNGHLKIAKILLKYGADPARKNDSLENPLDVSASTEIDALLEEFSSLATKEREAYAFSEDSSSDSSSEDDVSSIRSSDVDPLQTKSASSMKEKRDRDNNNGNFNEDDEEADDDEDDDNEVNFIPRRKRRSKLSRVSSSAQKRIISDDDEDSDDDDIELSRISEMVKRKKLAMAEESDKAKQSQIVDKGTSKKDEDKGPISSTPKNERKQKVFSPEGGTKELTPNLKKVERKRKISETNLEVSVGRPRKKYQKNDQRGVATNKSNSKGDSTVERKVKDKAQLGDGSKENGPESTDGMEKDGQSENHEDAANREEANVTKSVTNNPYISDISDAEEEEEERKPARGHDKITSDMFRANIFTNVLDRLSDQGSCSLSPATQSDAGMAPVDGEKGQTKNINSEENISRKVVESESLDNSLKGAVGMATKSNSERDQSSSDEMELNIAEKYIEPKKQDHKKTDVEKLEKRIGSTEDVAFSAGPGSEKKKLKKTAAKLASSLDNSDRDIQKKVKKEKLRIPSSSEDHEMETRPPLVKKRRKDYACRETGDAAEKNASKDLVIEGVQPESPDKLLKKFKKKRKEEFEAKKEGAEDVKRDDFVRKEKDKDNSSKLESKPGSQNSVKIRTLESESETKEDNDEKQSPSKSKSHKLSDKCPKVAMESPESKNNEKIKDSKIVSAPSSKKKAKALPVQNSSNERPRDAKIDVSKEEEIKPTIVAEIPKGKDLKVDRSGTSSAGLLPGSSKEHSVKSGSDVPKKSKKDAGGKDEKSIKTKDSTKETSRDQKKNTPETDADSQRSSPEKLKSLQTKKPVIKLKDGKQDSKKGQDSEKILSKGSRKSVSKDPPIESSRDVKIVSAENTPKASPIKDPKGATPKELKTTPVKGRRESKEVDLKIWDFGLQIIAPPKVAKASKHKEQKKAMVKENRAKKESDLKAIEQQQQQQQQQHQQQQQQHQQQHNQQQQLQQQHQHNEKSKKADSAGKGFQSSNQKADNVDSELKVAVEEHKGGNMPGKEDADEAKSVGFKDNEEKLESKKSENLSVGQQDEGDQRDCSSVDKSPGQDRMKHPEKVLALERVAHADEKNVASDEGSRPSAIEVEHIGKVALEASDAVSMDSPSSSQVKLETPVGSVENAFKMASKMEVSGAMLHQDEEPKDRDAVSVEASGAVKEQVEKQPEIVETVGAENGAKPSSNEGEVKVESGDGLILNDFGPGSDLDVHLGPFHGTKLEETDIDMKELSNPEDTLKMLTQEMHRQRSAEQENKPGEQGVAMTGHDFTILSEQINEKIKHLSSRSFVSELSEEEKHIVNISMEMAENLSQDGDHSESHFHCTVDEGSKPEDDPTKSDTSTAKDSSAIEAPASHSESCDAANENIDVVLPPMNLSSSPSAKAGDADSQAADAQSSAAVTKTSSSLVLSHLPVPTKAPSTRSKTVDLEPRGISQVVADIDLNSIPRCILESSKPAENATVSVCSLPTPVTPSMSASPAAETRQPKEVDDLSQESSNSSSLDRLKRKPAVQGQSMTWRKAMFSDHHFSKLSLPKHFHDFSLITEDYWQTDSRVGIPRSDIEEEEVKEMKDGHEVELKRLHLCMEQELVRVESRYQSMCKNRKPISACATVMYQRLEQYSKLNVKSSNKTKDEASISNEEIRRNSIKEVLDKYIKKEEDMLIRHEQESSSLDRRLAVEKIQRIGAEKLLRGNYLRERVL